MKNDILNSEILDKILKSEYKSKEIDNVPCDINLNLSKDEENNDYFITYKQFGIRPNKITIHSQFNTEKMWGVINENFEVSESNISKISEIIPEADDYIYNTKYFIKLNDSLFISFLEFDKSKEDNLSEELFCSNLTIYYNPNKVDINYINDLLFLFNSCIINFEQEDINKVNILSLNLNNEFELDPIEINEIDNSNIKLYYNFDFQTKLKKVSKKINKNNKGISIFYGERGCGKTTFLSQVMRKVNKRVIYIPPNLAEHTINSIDLTNFLKRYNNSVIVIDDSELFINRIHQKSNIYVNNLLQLTDSIISESLNVNIILVANLKEDEIDTDIFESNSLINKVKFGKLSSKKSKKLSKILENKNKFKSSTKLTHILKDEVKSVRFGY